MGQNDRQRADRQELKCHNHPESIGLPGALRDIQRYKADPVTEGK